MNPQDEKVMDDVLKKIKNNSMYLLDKEYPENILINNAFSRGIEIFRGNNDKQTIIDLIVIALSILVKREIKEKI